MKFKLVESFNYPVLYHGTYNINEILRDNSLHLGKTYGNLKPAVCLTRDYNFVKNKFPFIIVLIKNPFPDIFVLIILTTLCDISFILLTP